MHGIKKKAQGIIKQFAKSRNINITYSEPMGIGAGGSVYYDRLLEFFIQHGGPLLSLIKALPIAYRLSSRIIELRKRNTIIRETKRLAKLGPSIDLYISVISWPDPLAALKYIGSTLSLLPDLHDHIKQKLSYVNIRYRIMCMGFRVNIMNPPSASNCMKVYNKLRRKYRLFSWHKNDGVLNVKI
jgi:hypothetical protein